jgi:MYXO-CTERM domain-containing protein
VEAFIDDLQLTSNLPACDGLPPPAPPPKLDGGPLAAASVDGGPRPDARAPDAAPPEATGGADAAADAAPATAAAGGCGCRVGDASQQGPRAGLLASLLAVAALVTRARRARASGTRRTRAVTQKKE